MAKFCRHCGRKLVEGEPCICQQTTQQQVPPVQQPQQVPPVQPTQQVPPVQQAQQVPPVQQTQQVPPNVQQQYQQYQQVPPNMQQQYQQPRQPSAAEVEVKNLFSQIPMIIKTPITRAKELAATPTKMGIEMIIARAVVALILVLLLGALMGAQTGGYIEVPYLALIFGTLFLTAGTDFLEALFLKAFTKPKDPSYTYSFMTVNVGVRAYQSMLLSIADFVLFFLAMMIGNVVFIMFVSMLVILAHAILGYVQMGAYCNMVGGGVNDGKVYRYALARICIIAIRLLIIAILSIAILDVVTVIMMNSLMGSMESLV